ncbi:MAG: radical SAM protein [Nitrospirae bacterium]|nr:radical SAM protein [Nitrospirota bacterium]
MIKGHCDRPKVMRVMKSISVVEGWIVSDSKLHKIDVHLDGKCLGQAVYGIERNDVVNVHPDIEGSRQSRFRYLLKTTDFPDGKHLLEIKASNDNKDDICFSGEVAIDNSLLTRVEINQLRLLENYSNRETTLDSMPTYLFIEPSKMCNLECIMCRSREYIIELKKRGVGIGTMKWDVFDRIETLFPYISYFKMAGWGEPYTNVRFPEMINRIRRHNEKAMIGFNTNALLLNEEKIKNLIENRVTNITISIDSPYKENYELIRKNGSYERLVNNLQMILELKEKYASVFPLVGFEYVVMNQNVLDMPEYVKFASRFGVSSIVFVNVGIVPAKFEYVRFNEHGKLLDVYNRTKEYAKASGIALSGNAVDTFESLLNNRGQVIDNASEEKITQNTTGNAGRLQVSCLEPFQSSYVCFDGNISPCCVVGGNRFIGNVLEGEFEKIWNNEAYVNLRKAFIAGKYSESMYGERCKVCIDKKFFKSELFSL